MFALQYFHLYDIISLDLLMIISQLIYFELGKVIDSFLTTILLCPNNKIILKK